MTFVSAIFYETRLQGVFDIIITERQEIFHTSCLLHISHYTCLLIPIHSPVTGNLIPAMLFGTIQRLVGTIQNETADATPYKTQQL